MTVAGCPKFVMREIALGSVCTQYIPSIEYIAWQIAPYKKWVSRTCCKGYVFFLQNQTWYLWGRRKRIPAYLRVYTYCVCKHTKSYTHKHAQNHIDTHTHTRTYIHIFISSNVTTTTALYVHEFMHAYILSVYWNVHMYRKKHAYVSKCIHTKSYTNTKKYDNNASSVNITK